MFGKPKTKPDNGNLPVEVRMGNSKIYSRGVTKTYFSKKREVSAVDNVDMDILENEFVCIVGPSGCGKSTLLRMIGGLDDISSGSIILDDRILTGPGADRGMVFQSYSLFPWMTVEKNIGFGLKLKKTPKETADKIVTKYLELIGLEDYRKLLPKELSGGMKQRVAIARALANSPEVLLMDEPFGALDPQTKANMQLLMRQIWQKERTTVVFVTHDIEEAVFLSTRVLVMSQSPGKIIADVPVYLPYDRNLDLKDTPDFISLRKQINTLLHGE
ncbi:ABC transporter ATP-binding protein [Clostridia bacterium]|nr:ABC transporter ATP-binding protein [Clostridia bacterium]